MVRFYPVKIGFEKKLIIPIEEQYYLFEYYSHFKGVYFLNERDTLNKVSDSIYQGSSVYITFNKFEDYPMKPICDSLINQIRNSSLSFRTSIILDDSARFNIGYDNQQFKSEKYEGHPTKKQQYNLCHNDYTKINSIWKKHQLEIIEIIRKAKQQRFEEISSNNNIDEETIREFLKTFNQCELDQRAFLVLLTRQPKKSIQAINALTEIDFYSVQLKLSDLPSDIEIKRAIKKLKDLEHRSKYKRKLIRALKKNDS